MSRGAGNPDDARHGEVRRGGYAPHLDWIASRQPEMRRLLVEWANINSGSHNLAGLEELTRRVEEQFAALDGEMRRIPVRPQETIDSQGRVVERALGPVVSIRKWPRRPVQVLLNIHLDTVYSADDPFQRVETVDDNTLRGPGVADAKGGLVVLLTALSALERSGVNDRVGWQVLLNSDEEIGSPGSAAVLKQHAQGRHLALVFEPALQDGTLVAARGGSGNFTAVVRGRAAHAGRDFHLGRNALHALADLIVTLAALNDELPGVTVNVAKVEGGSPPNIVPDLAIARFNVRVKTTAEQQAAAARIDALVAEVNRREGITLDLAGGFYAPPKPVDAGSKRLMDWIAGCGQDLNVPIRWRDTGGVSDGNRLAAFGLPVVDTMGVRGGNIHSHEEYILLDSLAERARLTALLLMKLGSGEIEP